MQREQSNKTDSSIGHLGAEETGVGLDDAVTLSRAAKFKCLQRNGRPAHIATLYRWSQGSGVRGVKLFCWQIGGSRVTTLRECQKFLERLSHDDGSGNCCPTRMERERSQRMAERELAEDGFNLDP